MSQVRIGLGDEELPQYDVSFEMTGLYAPAKISVQFAYAQQVSGVTNVTTLSGRSLWTSQVSPINFEFDAKDVDSYEFDFSFSYNNTVEQMLQIAYWSGTLPPNSERYRISSQNVLLHFKIVATTEPVIPSKEEIAQQVVIQVKQDLQDYMNQIIILTTQFQENIMTMWAVIGASVVSSMLSLIVALYAIRTSHRDSPKQFTPRGR
jgi:hypothetical protein